ncbi:unnamed protein product [Brachionus calyciflorus]|uniref:Uncharacterized protein n=1 Tax=Brachionus calyciflorus TaxID=104777 RepID=A0A814NP51_9BILA|nr:unnamed protein product [Brachionus calyciflorus]
MHLQILFLVLFSCLINFGHSNACDLRVTLKNDGFLIARFRLLYSIDGIIQPLKVSKTITILQSDTLIVPSNAKDLQVIVEQMTWQFTTIFTDSGISIDKCTKCYKVWGLFTSPRWDHLACK